MASKRPVAIDLFCGAGGLSLGLEQAGFDIVLGVDRDPFHVATHQRNFPYGATLCKSINEITGADLLQALGSTTDIDLICGGPPCQGFSHIGKRRLDDPRNELIEEFVRLVLELGPKSFLLENVPGIRVGARGDLLDRVAERLARAGYSITLPVKTLNALDYGVPQGRARVFLLGVRKEFDATVPYPPPCPEYARPTVWQAIRDLPVLEGRKDLFKLDISKYRRVAPSRVHPYAAIARGLHDDRRDLSYRRIWDGVRCSGCQRVRHRSDVRRLYSATAPGAVVPVHNLPRLHPSGVAPTLRAGTDSEHGSFNAPRPIHPSEPRCISVREAARLHGYPDWFRFYPRKWHAHRQIGNSVCPPVARALGNSIVRTLGLRVTKPRRTLALADEIAREPDMGRLEPRIPQLTQWPKIFECLLRRSGADGRGGVVRPDFSIQDVQSAYEEVGARMPRTPPGQFLADVARSRNRDGIVQVVRENGLSVVEVSRNGTYGSFVPLGTGRALGERQAATVNHREIARARKIHCGARRLSARQLMRFLEHRTIRREVFGKRRVSVSKSIRASRGRGRVIGEVEFDSGARSSPAVVLALERGDMPTLPAVGRLLDRTSAEVAIITTALTRRHFAVFVFDKCNDSVVERRRRLFRV